MLKPALRTVRLSSQRPYSFGDYQLNYLDYRTRRIIPSTDLWFEDELYYRSNSLGCRGEELTPGVPVVGLFGDSVMHGFQGEWLAKHVSLPGCQVLNAGVEGLQLPWIVDRVEELLSQVPRLVCAAIHSGWHNITYNARDEAYWAAQLDRVQGPPVIAHFRLVADINEETVRQGYEAVLATVPGYLPWHGFDYTTEAGRRGFLDDIARFNTFIERYCAERGRVLIDQDAAAPRTHADLGVLFCDFIHPSPDAYPRMARAVEQALARPIRVALEAGV